MKGFTNFVITRLLGLGFWLISPKTDNRILRHIHNLFGITVDINTGGLERATLDYENGVKAIQLLDNPSNTVLSAWTERVADIDFGYIYPFAGGLGFHFHTGIFKCNVSLYIMGSNLNELIAIISTYYGANIGAKHEHDVWYDVDDTYTVSQEYSHLTNSLYITVNEVTQ